MPAVCASKGKRFLFLLFSVKDLRNGAGLLGKPGESDFKTNLRTEKSSGRPDC